MPATKLTGLTSEDQAGLAYESLRLERIRTYLEVAKEFVPAIAFPGTIKDGVTVIDIDPDVDNARTLCVCACFAAIQAEATADVYAVNHSRTEAGRGREEDSV